MRPIENQPAQFASACDRVTATDRLRAAPRVDVHDKDVEVRLTKLLNANPPPIDVERVEEIRRAIENGTYSIEPARIADAMIAAAASLRKSQ